jgi:hypothetical protein
VNEISISALGIMLVLLAHLVTVIHYFARISGKVENMDNRLERLEGYFDSWIQNNIKERG